MTESKKKTTKKEVVEKNDDVVKPVKKAKVKETKEKLIEQALEEEILPVQEEAVKAKPPKKEAEAVNAEETGTSQPGDEEIREVSAEVKKERKPKKAKAGQESEIQTESGPKLSAEEFDWESFETEEQKNSPKHKEYEAMYDETLSTVAVDEVVHGTVIQMTAREVVINIGYKSEGVG